MANLEVDRASGLRPSCAVGDSGNVGAYSCMLAVCEGRLALMVTELEMTAAIARQQRGGETYMATAIDWRQEW